jgi:aminopeptidase N
MSRLLLVVAVLAALATPSVANAAERPSPGAAGLGDRLFPQLGNGGYDVQHYDISLSYAGTSIDGTVTIGAKATQVLSRFDLDFAGDGVGSVTVDGAPATFKRSREELVITPATPLAKGKPFTVTVSHYTAHARQPSGSNLLANAFVRTPDGTATLPQPAGAHVFLPSNDHPRDKATFTFRLDVPDGVTAVANGELESQSSANGRTTFVYQQKQPMAAELTQLAVGHYQVIDRGVQDGVHVRDVVEPSMLAQAQAHLPAELDHLAWLTKRLGPYPFGTYGSFVTAAAIGGSLETQTLSFFPRDLFAPSQYDNVDTTMLHELAHQWFGDSVSPREWSDVWLNEGHASYYEWAYGAEHGGMRAASGFIADTFDGAAKYWYALGDTYRHDIEPVAKPKDGDVHHLFSSQQYRGGALVLYALRQKVGERTFEKIEREWVTRYAGRSASTADYIALASKVSRRNLDRFLRDWLYGTKTPPMPGHPDWKVDPVPSRQRGASGRGA